MITNFDIDDGLLREALALTVDLTPKAIMEEALREYIERRNQVKILELFGTVEYEPDYDYKQQRQKG
jgi:Bacterial antitoxin of type II TA system, VapB